MSNVVSILTPAGVGAIAVVRLRGALVDPFIARHLSRPPRVGRCVHTELRDDDAMTIDDPVVVRVDAQTLDLSLHGGSWVIQRMIETARAFGFTEIAASEVIGPDAGDDPIEQDVFRDLPRAQTGETLAILLAQPGAWRRMISENDRDAMRRALADRSLAHLLNPPTVAIVGAPNVGKSTLANQLFARDHSITADLPGTTRDWVGEQANLDGLVVTLIDTPGVRQTHDPIEQAAIESAKDIIRQADAVVLVLDITQPLAEQVEQVSDVSMIVLNKIDRPGVWDQSRFPDAAGICAVTGAGVDQLRQRLRQWFGCDNLHSFHARCWTDAQRARLESALQETGARLD